MDIHKAQLHITCLKSLREQSRKNFFNDGSSESPTLKLSFFVFWFSPSVSNRGCRFEVRVGEANRSRVSEFVVVIEPRPSKFHILQRIKYFFKKFVDYKTCGRLGYVILVLELDWRSFECIIVLDSLYKLIKLYIFF